MNADTICKYAASALLMASVLALVILGQVDASLYVALVTSALAGIGVHAASTRGAIAAPADAEAPASTLAPTQEVKS
jgi:hypothetical protein